MSPSRLTGQSAGLALCLSILLFCFATPVKSAVAYINNDNFADAETVVGDTGSLTVGNDYGTLEPGEPNHAGHATGCSVWYKWQATASGNVTFNTAGSHGDTVIGVYTGSSLSALNEVASDDDTGYDLHSTVTFDATLDTVYYIALDVYDWASYPGAMSLNWHLGDAAPTPTPAASNRIAFSAARGAAVAGVYVMNGDGVGQTRLTDKSSYNFGAVWSQDGTKIAFNSYRDGQSEIYLMNADGSNQINLTNTHSVLPYAPYNGAPAWSPDGTQLAFSSDRGGQIEVYMMNNDGSNLVRLTNSSGSDEPRWSADGLKIAFTTNRDGNQEIYSMNSDGSGQVNLTNHPGYDSLAGWQAAAP